MNTEDKILEIVNLILQNRQRKTLSGIEGPTRLRDDIGFDSLDLAELTVRIEAEYDVDIFENGIVSTIQEVYDKISSK
ncbi:acyl carrier protein [bacterium]|nr:acyl carrier protein [bacterium]